MHNKQITEGLAVLDEAMALVAENGVCYYEAELYRIKGELIMSQSGNDKYEAESYLEKALVVAHRQQSKSLELRALISLCRLRRNLGKSEKARCILSNIYEWFTEGFDTADLKDAKALLYELSQMDS